jgi:hypothetical protein
VIKKFEALPNAATNIKKFAQRNANDCPREELLTR